MYIATSGSERPPSLVLHIGPRKTGTTAIQQAFAARREDLPSHGVVYPGDVQQHFMVINRFIGRRQLWEEDHEVDVAEGPLRKYAAEIGDAPHGVISTEIMSQLREGDIRRVFGAFPKRSPQVVITYRPFNEILTSTWQQLVKEGLRESLDEWSRKAVSGRPERGDDRFPRTLDLADLVETWADVVGVERIAVVLVNRGQPHAIFNAFEELLALPEGYLVPSDEAPGKRSLTAQEAELLRRINTLLPRDANSLKKQRQLRRVVAKWVDRHPPGPTDTKLTLPADVAASAQARAEEMVTRLDAHASKLRVFGDLSTLAQPLRAPAEPPPEPISVDMTLASHWLTSVVKLIPTASDS